MLASRFVATGPKPSIRGATVVRVPVTFFSCHLKKSNDLVFGDLLSLRYGATDHLCQIFAAVVSV